MGLLQYEVDGRDTQSPGGFAESIFFGVLVPIIRNRDANLPKTALWSPEPSGTFVWSPASARVTYLREYP